MLKLGGECAMLHDKTNQRHLTPAMCDAGRAKLLSPLRTKTDPSGSERQHCPQSSILDGSLVKFRQELGSFDLEIEEK